MAEKKGEQQSLGSLQPLSLFLMEHLSVGVVFVNHDKILTLVNRAAEHLLQISCNDVIGKRVDMLSLRNPLYKVLSEDCRQPVEMVVGARIVAVSTLVLPLGELTEIRDVTAERKEKRQREETVAMMTHDLKSPLTVMSGYLQMVKETLHSRLDTDLLAHIKEVDRCMQRILLMIEDILDSYRLELGLLTVTRDYADVRGLLEAAFHDALQEAHVQGINLTFSGEGEVPLLEVDGRQLSRVFANLIGNALKFTPEGGSVSVGIACQGESGKISISDTGIGIRPEDLGRIFKKYYRTAAAAGYKGTGLGLAISKAIVEAHSGTIEVSSTEGGGSTFVITLPFTHQP